MRQTAGCDWEIINLTGAAFGWSGWTRYGYSNSGGFWLPLFCVLGVRGIAVGIGVGEGWVCWELGVREGGFCWGVGL